MCGPLDHSTFYFIFIFFTVSPNYVSGVVEQNKFFPNGLCCENNEDLKAENVSYIIEELYLLSLWTFWGN